MRILDRIAQFVLQSRLRACITTILLVFLPPLRWAGWAILGFVTLRQGSRDGGVILASIAVFVLGMGIATIHWASPETLPANIPVSMMWFGIVELVLSGFVVWGFALILRQTVSWTRVLQVAVWVGVAVLALIHLFYPDITAWWAPFIKENMLRMQKALPELLTSDKIAQVSEQAAKVITGVHLSILVFLGLFSLFLARWWQASLYNPGGLRPELLQIRLGVRETVLLGVIILFIFTDISAMGTAIAMDCAPLIGLIFVLAGISLVHRLMNMIQKPWIGLLLFYGLLVFETRYVVLVLISLAVIDSGVNVSSRLIKR